MKISYRKEKENLLQLLTSSVEDIIKLGIAIAENYYKLSFKYSAFKNTKKTDSDGFGVLLSDLFKDLRIGTSLSIKIEGNDLIYSIKFDNTDVSTTFFTNIDGNNYYNIYDICYCYCDKIIVSFTELTDTFFDEQI